MDAFWDSKGLIDPADFRNFCSPVVPLLRFPKAVYTADEYFEANAELSNYSDEVLKGVQAKWKISKEGTIGPLAAEKSVIASGTFTATTAHSEIGRASCRERVCQYV